MTEYTVITKRTIQWLVIIMMLGWAFSIYLIFAGIGTYEQNVIYYNKILDLQQELEMSKAETESCIMENSLLNGLVK